MEANSAEQEHRSEKKLRLQGPAELIADLRQMVNNSTLSDIVFVCSDGKRVQALRKLVAGRSEVLKGLLLNGMAETTQSEIELPEISSRALLSVLEFLYTGALLDYGPESWTIGCELLLASRFFILPTLENIIRIFMHEQILSVVEDQTKAASLLTEALACGLCGEKDGFLEELVRILSSARSSSVYVQNLSEDAFQYLLANSKGNREGGDSYSLREYERFVQVILWWFYKSDLGSEAKKKLVGFMASAVKKALFLFKHRERGESTLKDAPSLFNALTSSINSSNLHHASKHSVMRLLSNIDCRRMHPILLSKLVEPLNLISAAEILNSFRFHALHRRVDFGRKIVWDYGVDFLREIVWDHGGNCRSLYVGKGIQKAGSKIGLAVMKLAFDCDTDDSWRFAIDVVSEDFVELGLFSYSSEVGTERPEFDGKRLSEQDHALVLKFQGTQVFVKLEGPLERVNWQLPDTNFSVGEVIKHGAILTYNGSEHICSLCLGEYDLGVIWKNVSRRLYYPAICFGNSSKGQVSMYKV